MEPDIIRTYSSSPPPLDDTPEEEDEEFGDFGGFTEVASSVSFSEFDSPKGFAQSRTSDSSAPGCSSGLVPASFTPGGPGQGSGVAQLRSDREPCDPGCSHTSPLPDRMYSSKAVRKPTPRSQAASGRCPESHSRGCNQDVSAADGFNNGFAPFDVADSPVVRPKKRGPAAKPTPNCCGHRPVTSLAPVGSPQLCSLGSDTPTQANRVPGGKSLAGMPIELRCGTGLAKTSSQKNGVQDSTHSTRALGSSMGEESEYGNPKHLSTLQEQCPPILSRAEEVGGAMDESTVAQVTVSASVSDDFASFCQAVSPDGLEDFGDFNATGIAAPPLLEREEPPTACTNEEVSFGDFGQMGLETLDRVADLAARPTTESTDQGESGGSVNVERREAAEDGHGEFAGFPGSDSFADFRLEPASPSGWSTFGQPEEVAPAVGSSWATFRVEQGAVLTDENKDTSWDAAATAPLSGCLQTCRSNSLSASLAMRLERLFRVSFPAMGVPEVGGEVPSLKAQLEPHNGQLGLGEERSSASHSTRPQDVWWRLQDIHNAFGLQYQWGGSHSNRVLLCSLGIVNLNILSTGQKKQYVIVPSDTASLGMLEPTKDPVSTQSVAEKIVSIAREPSTSLEMSTSPDSTQDALLPIQFDWSSSGLTNPLDGKLTTSKLETSNTSSLPDSFAHLISPVGKTCSSTRQEGTLSKEAAMVMVALPDLSFMLTRVLMFPVAVT